MASLAPAAGSARARIIDASRTLFYARGLRAAGVDALIAESGVAKATFYKHFPSKDDLIVAYLDAMDAERMGAFEQAADAAGKRPADRLLGALDALPRIASEPGYRGCAFINAAGESPPGSPAHARIVRHGEDRLGWFSRLATEAGAMSPQDLAASLCLLIDGALAAGAVEPADPDPPHDAVAQGRRLVKRALKQPRAAGKGTKKK